MISTNPLSVTDGVSTSGVMRLLMAEMPSPWRDDTYKDIYTVKHSLLKHRHVIIIDV